MRRLSPDEHVAGFEVTGVLGRGSNGIVYHVRRGSEQYAMKVPTAREGAAAGIRALRREAALLSCVDHPAVPRVHDVGVSSDGPYLVMDLVEGRPLAELLAEGPMAPERVIATAIDVAELLAAAHRAGIVHRDLKPENVVVDADRRARVVDFSLAARSGVTSAGVVAGTMLYCAPEQSGMLDRPVDGRADLYALGAVLYQCATGSPPFTSASVGDLLRQHASAPVPDPRAARAEVPDALAALIRTLLAKDPDDRYQTSERLVADLRRLGDGPAPAAGTTATPVEPSASRTTRLLVGRSAEKAELAARWARARQGTGGVALISGPAGGGKSRLAAELLTMAAADGALVLTGRTEPSGSVPLAAIRQALDAHVGAVHTLAPDERAAAEARARAAAGTAAPLLAGISPAVGELLGSPEPVTDDDGQLFAPAVVGFLVALARAAGGMVLHIDDVQWLDDGSRRVLPRLASEIADAPLLLLAAARDDRGSEQAVASFRAAAGDAVDLTIPLEPLTTPAVAELVAGATGGMVLDGEAAGALAAHSAGNPFVVLECLPAIVDAGLLSPSGGIWSIDAEGLRDLDLSAGADRVVLERLDGLDATSHHLLSVGAVIGPRFTAELIADVTGTDPPLVRAAAGAAAWRGLVEAVPGGDYVFVHDRIREALLACFDDETRAAVHGRIAEVLDEHDPFERRPDDRRADDPGTVYARARHCQLAGPGHDPGRTFRACAAAGALALADHAPSEAVSLFDGAADAAGRAGIDLDPGFLVDRGIAQQRAGRFADAVASLNQAHDLAVGPLARARILDVLARVHDSTWSTADQLATVDRALAELGRPMPLRPALAWLSMLARFGAGQVVRTTRIGHGTVTGARRERYELLVSLHNTAALGHAREMRAPVSVLYTLRQLWWVGRLGRGPQSARTDIHIAHLAFAGGLQRLGHRATRRAVATAAEVGDPRSRAYVDWISSMGRVFFDLDQGETVRKVYAEQERWLGLTLAHDLVVVSAVHAFMRGDLADAEKLTRRRKVLITTADQGGHLDLHTSEPCVLALQGQHLEAVTYVQRLLEPGPDLLRWQRVDLLTAQMMVAVEQHDLDDGFDRVVEEWDSLGLKLLELLPTTRFAYVFMTFGRLQQCRRATPERRAERLVQARAAVRQLHKAANIALLRAWDRVAGAALAEVSGDPAGALAALEKAEPVLREVDAPLVAFEAARVRAHALAALHVDGEAHRQASYALSLAIEQRWPHRARQVEAEFGLDRRAPMVSSGHASSDTVALGRYRQRLAAVQQVGMAASRELDPTRLTAIALDETIRLLGAERAYLFLVDGDGGDLVPAGGRDRDGNELAEPTDHSTTLIERVRRSGEPLVVTGPDDGEALGAESVVLHGLRSVLVAPLLHDGRLAGIVYLDSRVAKGIFSDEDVGILVAITNHIVVALETARAAQLEKAVARANQQRDLAETVRDALADISGSLQPDEVLRRVLTTVVRVTGTDEGWLVLTDESGATVRVMSELAGDDDLDCDRPLDQQGWRIVDIPDPDDHDDLLARVLSLTRPVTWRSPSDRPVQWGRCVAGAYMAIPLMTRDRRVGVIALTAERPDTFASGESDMAVALISQGMIAYDNACLFAQVQELATTDGLTGVANRRHFFEQAEDALDRARRQDLPLVAMMIDVDNFKAINDRHGHRVGDAVLRGVAERLAGITRDGDLIGRYGGEEFAVVLTAEPDLAATTAERLRRAVADMPVGSPAGPVPVTISVGIAGVDDASTVSDLLDRADDCLYRAKRTGRNRVFVEWADPARGGAGHP